jgi:suppressor of ftsI
MTPCAPAEVTARPSRDLYCIELISADADEARGTAELNWPGGPFTVAVGVDGTHRWRLTMALAGLPESMLVGPRAGFVAWVSPPSLDSFIKLGVVRNGETTLAPAVELDRFYVHITAEPDTSARSPAGRPVLRGESAGNRLRPADNYQFFLGALAPSTGGVRSPMAAAGHAGHGASTPRDSLGWTDVPMYPGLDMLPSEMALRPAERAWRPPDDPTAPLARGREVVTLRNGDTLDLTAGVVRRSIAGRSFTMFGFNGQHPGPLLVVPHAATVTVRFKNRLPLPSTVHWHGLRLDNRNDGVPGLTQDPVVPGGEFVYTLRFPDAGIYWYHPHVREDLQQDLGLYGNIFVRPRGRAPVDREEFLILDDILIGEDGLVPWGGEGPTHAAMGRFGNTFLVNGEPGWRGSARGGEVVRYYLTNASNTRTFNLSFGGARMKLIGSDLGPYFRQQWVESIVIAPAERYVVDVRFERDRDVLILNRVRALDHLYGRFFSEVDTLGTVSVSGASRTQAGRRFDRLFDQTREIEGSAGIIRDGPPGLDGGRLPHRTLEARVSFTGLPFVSQRLMTLDSIYFNPVEWAGTMPGMNWATTAVQAQWTLRDPATGLENEAIRWTFKRGEMVRLRLVGVRNVLHAMQHPIHLHGQRFLVLAVNGIPNDIPVWKDTALLPAGGTLDLLVEMSNPGRWMLHCHIAEHLQSGMAMIFDVENE